MRRVRLRTILTLLVLATTIPVAGFAAWLIPRFWRQQLQLIDRQNVEQARAISVAIDEEVEATTASLNVFALLDPIDAADSTAFTGIAARVLPIHPSWESVRLIDRSLRVIATTTGSPGASPLINSEWVRSVIDTLRAPECLPAFTTDVLELLVHESSS